MTCSKAFSLISSAMLMSACVPVAHIQQAQAAQSAAAVFAASSEPLTMDSVHEPGTPDELPISEITAETLESYGVSNTSDLLSSDEDDSANAAEIAAAIDANPVLEAKASEKEEVEVYHPFENCSLVIDASADIPDAAISSRYSKLLDANIVDFPDELTTAAAFEEISSSDGAEAVFPDVDAKLCSVNYSDYDGWGMSDLNLSTAEYKLDAAASRLKSETTIAVIDTGLLSSHEVFSNTTILPSSGSIINSKKAALTSSLFPDDDGHGTHVAAIVAQGTPSAVKLLDVKCYNDGKSGARLSDIYFAMLYAKNQGARVFNISLGAQLGTGASAEATIAKGDKYFKEVVDAGGLVFVAAGNNGVNIDEDGMYPAVSNYTYAVGALDRDYALASYSNYGPSLDFVAPGSSIISAWNTSQTATKSFSGTSMACPHVSAIAANLMVMYPNASGSEIISKLKNLCVDLGTKGKDSTFGYGKPVMNISSIDSAVEAAGSTPAKVVNGRIKPDAVYYSGIAKTYKYTGKNLCPRPTIKVKIAGIKYTLERNKDYLIYYLNNKKRGTAKLRILLMGKYTGTYLGQFKIV